MQQKAHKYESREDKKKKLNSMSEPLIFPPLFALRVCVSYNFFLCLTSHKWTCESTSVCELCVYK